MLEGRAIGMELVPRPVASAPVQPSEVPTRPPGHDRPVARTAIAVSGDGFAPTAPWQVGLAPSVAWSPVERVFIGAAYRFVAAIDADGARAAVRVSRHPFELGVAYELPLGPVSIGAELLAELDPLAQTTTRVARGVVAAGDELRVEGAAGARFRLLYPVAPPLALFASGGIDVLLNGFRYAVEGVSGSSILLAPNRVRPRVDLGMAVDFR